MAKSWLVLALALLTISAGCTKEARKERHLDRANRFFQTGQFEEARLEYVSVLQLDPKQSLALKRLGSIFYDRGQVRHAFALFAAAKNQDPSNQELSIKVARLYLAGNEPGKARSEVLAVLDKAPANAEALVILASTSRKPEEVKEAEQRLQNVQSQLVGQSDFHLALGYLAMQRDDLKGAETELTRALELNSGSSGVYVALGSLRLRQNDIEQATVAMQKATEFAPRDFGMRLTLAELKLRSGQVEEAKAVAAEVMKSAPEYVPAPLFLARISLGQKDYKRSSELVDPVLRRDPKDADALLLRAQIALAQGNNNEAIAEYERLKQQLPNASRIQYQLALAYIAGKQPAKASDCLKQAIALDSNFLEAILLQAQLDIQQRNYVPAIASLSGVVARFPKLVQGYAFLGDAYRSQGRLDEALQAYGHWRELAPAAPQAPYLIGLILRQQRKESEARSAFEASLQAAPDFVPALEQLVDFDLLRREYEAALKRLLPVIDRNPKAPAPLLLLAKVHLSQGETNQVEMDLHKAIELDPGFGAAYAPLAELYVREGKYPQALEQLFALLAKKPDDARALLQIALIQEKTKEYGKAKENYEKLLKLSPNSAFVLNNIAYLCAERLGDLSAGLDYAKKARDLAPDNPSVADTLGWILCQRRDYSWGLAVLKEAAEKLPSQAEIQFHLGTAYYMNADEDGARTALKRALESSSDFPGKAKAQARLETLNLNPQSADSQTVAKLEERIAVDSADVVALLRLGTIAERAGEDDKALNYYRAALKVNPKSVALIIRLGRFYAERLHDPAKALEQATAARELAPEEPQLIRAEGQFAFLAKDYRRACRLLQESALRQSSKPDVLFEYAQAAYYAGRVPEAEQAIRQALQGDGSFAQAPAAKRLLEMIELGRASNGTPLAKKRAEEILQDEPLYIPALMIRGVLSEQNGPISQAMQVFETIYKQDPEFAPASRHLAMLYADPAVGKDAEAFQRGMEAREIFRQDAELTQLLGELAFRRKDYAHTVEFLKEGTQNRSADADLHYRLGIAYHALNQRSQSKGALQKALELNPNSPFAQEAKRLLAELK